MADLSAYIDFTVQFDYTQNKFVLNDTSAYPGGVENDVTGIFEITQPDQIREDGDWNSPDIIYDSGSLTTALRDLRRNSQNAPQKGSYTIKYTVDHPSYTPTVLSRTFTVQYIPVTASITENFDVFTPELTLTDATVYTVASYTTASTTRAWSVVVGTVGTVTGSTATLDLAIATQYYDATYVGTLATTVEYNHTSLTYLSIKDIVSGSVDTSANTPPDTCSLLAYLNTLKARLDALISHCQPYDRAKANYQYASDLYFHILERLKAGSTTGVIDYVEEFLTIYYNTEPPYTNTNVPISPYAFCYPTGGGSSAVGTLEKIHLTFSGTSTSYTNALFDGATLMLAAKEGLVIKDIDLDITGDTISLTNGDSFGDGQWATFLISVPTTTEAITKLYVLMTASASSYTSSFFTNKILLLTASEGLVIKDTDISLSGTTASKTQSGDQFTAGTWYTFILKQS